ncbi:MAG: PLP-dependent transferase [Chitinophagaceae bacterium]
MNRLFFPLMKTSRNINLAKQQMKGACGLLTFIIKANEINQIETFCESLQHILMAVSWGGHESLIIPKCASIKHEDFDADNTRASHVAVVCWLGRTGISDKRFRAGVCENLAIRLKLFSAYPLF